MTTRVVPALGAGKRAEIDRALRCLKDASILVIGDAMLDRYVYGSVHRISPEAPVPILSVEREVALPGGAGNVVRNLTALGIEVALISVVGDDQTGSDLTGLVGGQPGVEPWLLVEGGRITPLKTRFVSHGQQLLRADQEQTTPIQPRLAEQLLRIARDAMIPTTLTVLSDYGKGVLGSELAAKLIAAAHEAGRKVLVDSPAVGLACHAGADVIMPTVEELTEVTGLPAETDAELAEAAAKLRSEGSFGAVLVLRGEAGLALQDAEATYLFPYPPAELFDPSGLSDTVISALAAGLAGGLALPLAAEVAALAASIARSRVGPAVVLPADLLAALEGK
jgi:D-beta-D-heptose 7-phosphate kinase/D-beta-D-heptose 1-phosphate adenosyltransferase